VSGQLLATTTKAPIGQGAATRCEAMNCDPAVVVSDRAAGEALALRDQALAALDRGDPPAALAFAARGLVVLEAAGLGGGPDEAALLVAVAEIQEALGRFGDAGVTIATAIAILQDVAGDDDDSLLLWCQAQERLAGLERLAGDFDAAAARLAVVLDRAAAAFGEASMAVVSAANALGVAGKYASDLTRPKPRTGGRWRPWTAWTARIR